MKTEEQIREQYRLIGGSWDERGRRERAASEAMALGHGGIALVHRGTGIVRSMIGKGVKELRGRRDGEEPAEGKRRVRRPGGGRRRKIEEDPALLGALESLVQPSTRGDPESALRWTCKRLRVLADELVRAGHEISYRTVGRLLRYMDYRLQSNRKTLEGAQHADRDLQFEYINAQTKRQVKGDNRAISVDTKKKELVGAYKNGGREYRPKGEPEKVDVHDFKGELGRVSRYGVYDLQDNSGWVSVGISADTSEFAVETIRRWWYSMGEERYPEISELLITADCGGSNGYRTRLWKLELQGLADELEIPITVCHFPPGTSKWHKIEHWLFLCLASAASGRRHLFTQSVVRRANSYSWPGGSA